MLCVVNKIVEFDVIYLIDVGDINLNVNWYLKLMLFNWYIIFNLFVMMGVGILGVIVVKFNYFEW